MIEIRIKISKYLSSSNDYQRCKNSNLALHVYNVFGKTDLSRRGVTGTLISQYLHVTLGGVRPIEKRLVCSPLDRKSPLKFNEIVIINMYLFLQFESTAL